MNTMITGLIVRTEQDRTYLLEPLKNNDPKVRVNNILTTLRERGPFLECKDMFGTLHYVNAEHISEIFIGSYSMAVDE